MTEAGITIDTSSVMEAFEAMDMKHFKGAVRKTMRQGANVIRKSEQQIVKSMFPGGKSYPRDPNRKSGVLRGKQYGPLYKDVKLAVWKNAKGSNVSLFSGKKDNRWSVLMWLNDGTDPRTSKRSIRKKIRVGQYKTRHSTFEGNNGGGNRGRITPNHFFESASQSSIGQAQQLIATGMEKNILNAYNKMQTS